jgi:hypothetical protein
VKRVLVVSYSQTGQLRRVAESVCAPLVGGPDIRVDWCELAPQQPYPFPWPFLRFFDQFPEAVHLDPPALRPLSIEAGARYDLVILAYTVWFLSPSPPITAFLQSEQGRAVLCDTPVITLIACRNMWLMAQEVVKQQLQDAGARICDNIVLTDRGSSLATFITTPRWMLTGRSDPVFGLPRAGLADEDIRGARRFGHAIRAALVSGQFDGRTAVLSGLKAAEVDDRLIASEKIGKRSFLIWGKLIRLFGRQGSPARIPALLVYSVFLVAMILTVVPISMLIRALLRPLLAPRLELMRTYYEMPSGSGGERLSEFARD